MVVGNNGPQVAADPWPTRRDLLPPVAASPVGLGLGLTRPLLLHRWAPPTVLRLHSSWLRNNHRGEILCTAPVEEDVAATPVGAANLP